MLPVTPLVVEGAGQTYTQTMQLLYLGLGGLIDANADIIPEIKRRIPLAWACYDRFTRELYDMENAPFMPVEYRGDGHPDVRVCGLGFRPGPLKLQLANHNPLLRKDHWLSAPAAHRPSHVVRQGSQEGAM